MPTPTNPDVGRDGRRIATMAIRGTGLAAFVTAVYVAVLVAAGSLLGADDPRTGLMLLATAIVALGIGAVSRLTERAANRIVFGHRLSPWQAVDHLSGVIGALGEPDEALQSLAETIRGGTGTGTVDIRLWVGPNLATVAAVPRVDAGEPVDDQSPNGFVVPIVHGGQDLGMILVSEERLRPLERTLIEDLAAAAGVVARSVQLRRSLHQRIEVVRSHRGDLLAARAWTARAQLAERRRLELNLHDMCQQRAVVLAARFGLVENAARADPEALPALLEEISGDIGRLEAALAEVAGGRSSSLLATEGIGGALRAEVSGLGVEVVVVDNLGTRHRPGVEEAVFACCMEAIQNAVRHAACSRVEVSLHEDGGRLRFRIADDGVGFDPAGAVPGAGLASMRQRMDALGGNLSVSSDAGGTEIVGEVPA
jgi:signal transduction histidine kinase